MFKNIKSDYTGWLVFIGIIVLILEILFFNEGLIFHLFIAGGMVYFGRRHQGKKLRKLLFFYGGLIFLGISVLSMMTFRFLLVAIFLHFFIQYINSKKQPKKIGLEITQTEAKRQEPILSTKPLFENMFLGQQKTPSSVYEWNDINIQAGIGDTIIDLSYTVLPKGETVIFIRNLIGNIQILVPYELDVSVQHSCLMGSTNVFENKIPRMFNQVLHVKTPAYDQAEQKVKIITSLIVGNLEVNRI
ncbi:cell wall-active antibiotics response protein [Bacillus sp. X1(2014)]|nr:cell wall-active antibiotics response protein [Bacillus sp. X1(2014)]